MKNEGAHRLYTALRRQGRVVWHVDHTIDESLTTTVRALARHDMLRLRTTLPAKPGKRTYRKTAPGSVYDRVYELIDLTGKLVAPDADT